MRLEIETLPEDPTQMIESLAKVNLNDEKLDELIKLSAVLT